VQAVREIIVAMQDAAPKGRDQLDEPTLDRLRVLAVLLAASADANGSTCDSNPARSLGLPGETCTGLGDKNILVTGGTGCVGSMLMRQARVLRPGG
jgi:hypothetical protein